MNITLIIGLIIGLSVGLLIGGLVLRFGRKPSNAEKSFSELQSEHHAFREEVADHFVETANLINHLTDSYKEVFEHMQKGAQALVDSDTLREKLPLLDEDTIVLKRIGNRQSDLSTEVEAEPTIDSPNDITTEQPVDSVSEDASSTEPVNDLPEETATEEVNVEEAVDDTKTEASSETRVESSTVVPLERPAEKVIEPSSIRAVS